MTRPTRITVNAGDNSWESQLNTNLQQLYDRPLPPLLHAGTLANLETTRPAAQYQYCIAVVDYDSAGTPGSHMAFSNGTAWKLASNWELFQRRTFRATAGAISVADIDDSIRCTGGASFAVTLPAIADANEGRVIRIKQNGTGTVTVTPTGGDTIDGAATLAMASQYDGFEFISDGTSNWEIMGGSGSGGGAADFTSLTDTPANYTGSALKLARVNATPDALEFVTPTFLLGTDTPANYTGAASKFVKVNSTPDALEFATAAFTDLSDTPANYTSAATKTVKVNSGGTALEFVDVDGANLGNPLKHMARARTSGTEALGAPTGGPVDLPTETSSYGTDVTWVSGTTHFLINATGRYLITWHGQFESAGVVSSYAYLYRDTGGGYAHVNGSAGFDGNAIRSSISNTLIMDLDAGDKLQFWMAATGTTNSREGTSMSVLKLEASIEDGGDMEVFQQGLTAAETSALTTGAYVTLNLQSSIINNATDLYTFSAANDDVTLNEAGTYLISYTLMANQTVATLVTQGKLQKDIGAGFVDIIGTQSQLGTGGASNYSHGNSVLIELDATDKVRLQGWDVTGDGAAIAGTMLRIIRLKRGSDSIDFSTTAHKTGRKWHNGKDIWRKVVLRAGAAAPGVISVAHGIASIDRVVGYWGFLKRDDVNNQQIPINYGQLAAEVYGQMDDTNVVFSVSAAYTGAGNTLSDLEVIIEYTI